MSPSVALLSAEQTARPPERAHRVVEHRRFRLSLNHLCRADAPQRSMTAIECETARRGMQAFRARGPSIHSVVTVADQGWPVIKNLLTELAGGRPRPPPWFGNRPEPIGRKERRPP